MKIHLFALVAGLTWSLPAAAFADAPKGPVAMIAGLHQDRLIDLGRTSYNQNCAGCHGTAGDGKGPAAEWLSPKPRDFTRGLFKFRTTPWGSLPTDEDIYRTITVGVPGTSMPNWHLLPETERHALVAYLKTFNEGFGDPELQERPGNIPYPPADLKSAENVVLGRTVFRVIGCQQCHGRTGGGDGPSSGEMKDDWGQAINPANFQRGILRGGRTPRDIYRAIATGFSGTPMPAFGESLAEPKIWALVAYIRHLAKKGTDPTPEETVPECQVWDTCDQPADAATPATQGRN